MNHYSAFLRSCNIRSTNSSSSSSSNNENDENSSIRSILIKHLSKGSQQEKTSNNPSKGVTRGILGEVGNTALSTKSTVSVFVKPKIVQQQSVTTIIEAKSVAPLTASSIPIVTKKFEHIVLNEESKFSQTVSKVTEVPAELDCDSGDLHTITTAAEYVVDICKYWRELEQQTPIRQNFLLNRVEGTLNKYNAIDRSMNLFLGTASPQNRAILIDWLYQVHDRFKLLADTFHMAIQLIDRYLQSVNVSKHELQLIGSTGE